MSTRILHIIPIILIVGMITLMFHLWLNRRGYRSSLLIVGMFFMIAAFPLYTWTQNISILTEPIRITATNEKNVDSKGVEVSIKQISVENRIEELKNPEEGKWFHTGSMYMWRPVTDKRQPDGTTATITIDIPIGRDRAISFHRSEWGGKAAISIYGKTIHVDTYAQGKISIPDSRRLYLLLDWVVEIGMFCLILSILALAVCRYVYVFTSQRENHKQRGRYLYGGIAVFSLFFMVCYSHGHILWLDEIFQIGFSGVGKTLYETLMVPETTPPLFRLVANIWYNIVPYGEEWLLLLSELAVACSVYLIGWLGEEWKNRQVGAISALYFSTSSSLIVSCGYQFRAYGFLLMFSTCFLLAYLKCKKYDLDIRADVYLAFSMVLLAYTHYFGVFLCGAVFLYDFLLYLQKKVSLIRFRAYFIAGALYIPWLIRFVQLKQVSLSATWQKQPSLQELYNLIFFFCNNNEIILLVFLAGVISSVCIAYCEQDSTDRFLFPISVFVVFIACVYLYGKWINPAATLWVHRYFIVLFPIVGILIGLAADCIISIVEKNKDIREKNLIWKYGLCVILGLQFAVISYPVIAKQPTTKNFASQQYFDQAANWLYDQHTKIYSDTTLVISDDQSYVGDGWYEYYMIQKGRRDPVNYISRDKLFEITGNDEQRLLEYLQPYETVYLSYVSRTVNYQLHQTLEKTFLLDSDNTDLDIRTYVRRDTEGI